MLLRTTVQTAGLQSQMLINTIEMEHARHELERSQLEAKMARLRAEELDAQAHTDRSRGCRTVAPSTANFPG